MQNTDSHQFLWPTPPTNPQANALALARDIRRVIALAAAMAATGRRIKLNGLESAIGQLCARALDLHPDEAPAVRAQLLLLGTELDRLSATVTENQTRSARVLAH